MNPNKKGNIRDDANVMQLLVLANLESMNAEYIREGILQSERLRNLNSAAIVQMKSLAANKSVKILQGLAIE